MDVKCERCGAEYEFDDNRVTEEGVSVKCSSCGYLFRIRKRSVGPVQPLPPDTGFKTDLVGKDRLWMVRKPDGTVLVFKDLSVLQKWISENKIFREDEISRTGENWKRLGDVPELASFFQSVDQTNFQPAQYSKPSSPEAAPQSLLPLPVHPRGAPSFTGSSPSSPALPMGSEFPATAKPVASAPVMPASPAPISHPPPGQSLMSMSTINTIPSERGEPDSWGDLDNSEVEEDVVAKWKRRGRRKWFFIGPFALLVIGIGVVYMLEPVEFKKLASAAIGIETEDTATVTQPQDTVDGDAKTDSRVSEKSEESVKPIEPMQPPEAAKAVEVVQSVEPVKSGETAKPLAPAKPTTYDGWMSLAYRLQRAKRIKEALVAYDAALNLRSEDIEALTGKGQCLMAMGAYPAARALFERGLKINPRFGDALIGLAEANKRQGNTGAALKYFQKYIDLMPDGPDAELAIENINELKEAR